ncbi:5'-nucleotidase C-terminal domain-containing protein [Paracoccus sediminicola]|uniref:5'-nucleotidase C-terminal domain-containing protein n=1 Tax=Paracoccus sediminicola TaxID=3017783 RepID=UPI0022F09912|nr:5'-nucleotidase C-terminal domain-containing protein [Paracoccus sediminicola]WBU57742.1 5'-nucleotidase C-terminal domain-containing protein [Paracoccus sediminicola]
MPDGASTPEIAPAHRGDTVVSLRILATTDLHMRLGDEPGTGGLARLAPLIAAERETASNLLLFDNGDLIEGTPLADELARGGLGRCDLHPAIAALNRLGFDAATLGNHDFSHGVPFLRRVLRDAEYPVTLANAGLIDGPALWQETVLLDREMHDNEGRIQPVRVGVFGVLPPQTVDWEAGLSQFLRTDDVVDAARRAVSSLRAQGADVIVALSHGGHGSGNGYRAENAAGAIAELPGIDAVIAGHTHEVMVRAATGGAAPIIKAGFGGSHLAAVTLRLSGRAGSWRVDCDRAEVLKAADTPCPAFPHSAIMLRADAEARLNAPIGEISAPLSSHYALLGADPGLRLIEAALRAHIDEAMPQRGMPLLTAFAPFRTGGRGGPDHFVSIPAGPVRRADLSVLYPFTNHLAAIRLSGAEIREWLERAASLFRHLPGEATADATGPQGAQPAGPLIDRDLPGFQFDIIAGLDYQIDLGAPPSFDVTGQHRGGPGRIRNLRHAGRAMGDHDLFLLATNSYRMSGWPLYAPLTSGRRCVLPPEARIRVRDIVARHLTGATIRRPGTAQFFTLTAPPGTRVWFDTAPEAIPADCPVPVLEVARSDSGFQRLTLGF